DATSANTALRQQFKDASRIGAFLGKPVVGQITVRGDQVYFNGKPILSADQAALAAACQNVDRTKR
ncbi:MAG: hypothetical protein WCF16_10345, partial [Alphaproteobacteria bacterium]